MHSSIEHQKSRDWIR